MNKIAPVLILSAILASCATYEATPPARITDGVLTASNGMTLYVFDQDVAGSGKSVCNGPCATNWPPLYAMDRQSPGADFSVVTRNDGTKQWAFKGKPLYFWSKDRKPGDRTGDGFKKVWRVARP